MHKFDPKLNDKPGVQNAASGDSFKYKQKIRLVATDMDGTLLDDPRAVPLDFIEWVQRHPELCVVIASGRQYYNMQKLFAGIEEKLVFIADNGGIAFEQGKAVYVDEMTEQDVMECIRRLGNREKQAVILCGRKSAYMQHNSLEAEQNAKMYYERLAFVEDLTACIQQDQIVKIAVFFEKHNAERCYPELCDLNERLKASLSGECWIDLANKSANKGNALAMIQEKYHISREESVAFGDYLNDYELLQCCEMSYAMENAHPDLKKIARFIAPSNRDGGVQKVLQGIIP